MNVSPIAGYNLNSRSNRKSKFVSPATLSPNVAIKYDVPCLKIVESKPNFTGISRNRGIESLYKLMASAEVAQKFIDKLTKTPKDSKQNVRNLLKQYNLNNKEGLIKFSNWCLSPKGYYGAYEKFVENYFNKAESIEELLKFQPNWAPWKLEQKAWELKNPQCASLSKEAKKAIFDEQCNSVREVPFNIGTLPDIFQSQQTYENLVNKLKREDIGNQEVDVDGLCANISRLKGGELNNKFIYSLEIQNKKYILKFDRINLEDSQTIENRDLSLVEKRATRQNKYLAPDSIYSNVCMSKYLELNSCDLVPKCYYDHKTHSAIFEYINDINGDLFQQREILETTPNLNKLNLSYKELNSLGIYLNDTSEINVLKTKEGQGKIVDLGHARFMDTLKPGVRGYNIEFSNSSGPDIGAYYASLFRSYLGLT